MWCFGSWPLRPSLCLVWLAVILQCTYGVARECRVLDNMNAWRHEGGLFVRDGDAVSWTEVRSNGAGTTNLVEAARENGHVILYESALKAFLILRNDLAAVKHDDDDQFRQLYSGSFIKAVDCR
ncbi:hypothetical protein TRVL_06121 [Trypanosoma vivax]|uniref:Uncharacterized protein n=1 Tax=Trypanosoma vivax (strain Y486) TaxID=1055687 RepID=G0U573_TRYVY|nr:hypothetical protein TRVL_06121 [Trypanosoma vivax]CCC51021.1 conserved hypothetical protein [Trypanosoma vivax Y486]